MPALHNFARLSASLCAGLIGATALAGPRVTETADALPARDCEVEAGIARDDARAAPTIKGTDMVFGCGVGWNTQVNAAWVRERVEGASANGYGLLGKTTLVMPEAGRMGWGVAYGVAAARNGTNSLQWQQAALGLMVTREISSNWLVHANLGTSRDRNARLNSTVWSLGVESTDPLAMAADVYGDDRSRPWVSAGLGYSLGGGFSASARLARQIEQARARSLTLGAKLVF